MSQYGEYRDVVACDPAEGRTKQSMKDDCDINNILARYVKTGMLTHVAQGVPRFLDVSEVGDYRSAIERVRAADEFFSRLPAKVRAHFKNDVTKFLEFEGTDEDLKKILEEPKAVPAEPVKEEPPAPEGAEGS